MRSQFRLLQNERLNCSECTEIMEFGDNVYIVPDKDVVCYHGRALCECCIEREQRAETRDSGKMLLDAEVV